MKYTKEEKAAFMKMSLDDKIKRTKQLVMEWYNQFDGKVYVSFSGGKDSTVLLHIVRQLYPDVVGVFDDTGLEYPEIRDFVKQQDNIIWIKPKKTFLQVIREYGWPIISKEQSRYIHDLRNPKCCAIMKNVRLNGSTSGRFKLSQKWLSMLKSNFKISNSCCDVMKKGPLKKIEKELGLKPMVATMADESDMRLSQYMKGDCNEYSKKRPISKPMSFWSEQDILQYIKRENLEIADVYGQVVEKENNFVTTGVHRTGCMFCMYGLHLESKGNNRFDRMKETHPKLYDYIMNKLGGKEVIDQYFSAQPIKTKDEILLLCDYHHSELFNSYIRDFKDLNLKSLMTLDDEGNFSIFNGTTMFTSKISPSDIENIKKKAKLIIREI